MKVNKGKRKKENTRTNRDLGEIKRGLNFLVVTVHEVAWCVCDMVHARPSEQFEGKEGGLISINKHKSKRKQGVSSSVKKMMQSWLNEQAKKEETIHDAKKDGKTFFKRKKEKKHSQM